MAENVEGEKYSVGEWKSLEELGAKAIFDLAASNLLHQLHPQNPNFYGPSQ